MNTREIFFEIIRKMEINYPGATVHVGMNGISHCCLGERTREDFVILHIHTIVRTILFERFHTVEEMKEYVDKHFTKMQQDKLPENLNTGHFQGWKGR